MTSASRHETKTCIILYVTHGKKVPTTAYCKSTSIRNVPSVCILGKTNPRKSVQEIEKEIALLPFKPHTEWGILMGDFVILNLIFN